MNDLARPGHAKLTPPLRLRSEQAHTAPPGANAALRVALERVLLRTGESLVIRPIRPDDAERLTAFHCRLSEQSIYARYHAPHPHLPRAEVERLVNVDYVSRMAFVAVTGEPGTPEETIVAVARYAVDGPQDREEAEVAFLVDDRFQSRGLGTLLMDRLAAYAEAQGIRELIAETTTDNVRMIRLMRHLGRPIHTHSGGGGECTVRVLLRD